MEHSENTNESTDSQPIVPKSIELIIPGHGDEPFVPQPRVRQIRSRKRLALTLFIATCLSTYLIGGIWYTIPLMSILLAHEMGHYLQALRYGVPATLPYFIPMPIPPLGTMGAVIIQGAGYADRKALFDIAISGPLAGLVLALPIAYFGLQDAQFVPKDEIVNRSPFSFGEPLIFEWMIDSIHGPRADNVEVLVSATAIAGWVGIFITALNLIPIGQLDGGHILYTLIGKRAHTIAIFLLITAVGYMIYSEYMAYGLMIVLLLLMGPRHPPTADDTVPLGRGRIFLGWLTLSFIIVGFTPMPIVDNSPKPPEQKPNVEQKQGPLAASTKAIRDWEKPHTKTPRNENHEALAQSKAGLAPLQVLVWGR